MNRNLLRAQIALWGKDLISLVRQVHVLFSLIKHPLAPWSAKLVAGCGISYVFSPIQLIPTIIPIVGQLDDLFVLYLATRLVRKLTPGPVLEECEIRAQAAFPFAPLRIGFDLRRCETVACSWPARPPTNESQSLGTSSGHDYA